MPAAQDARDKIADSWKLQIHFHSLENAEFSTEAQGPTASAHEHAPPDSGPSSRRSEGFDQVEGLAILAYSA
jgi:hypothetical protein